MYLQHKQSLNLVALIASLVLKKILLLSKQ